MREILFRGKRIDSGEWEYGDLINNYDGRKFIGEVIVDDYEGASDDQYDIGIGFAEVNTSTIGQCVPDLPDKNGKKIFEGDIIRANHDGAVGVVRFGEYMSPSDPGHTRHTGYYVDWQGEEKDFLRADLGYWASRSDVGVIGNIHDNPELLEVGE